MWNLRSATERLRELEEIAEGAGLLNEQFSLNLGMGDLLELSDDEGELNGGDDEEDDQKKLPKSKNPFPDLEGKETVQEYVQKYKKASLNRKQTFQQTRLRWFHEVPQTGKILDHLRTLFCRKFLGS